MLGPPTGRARPLQHGRRDARPAPQSPLSSPRLSVPSTAFDEREHRREQRFFRRHRDKRDTRARARIGVAFVIAGELLSEDATSSILRANRPTWSSVRESLSNPRREINPWVGLKPITPQNAAGRIVEPFVWYSGRATPCRQPRLPPIRCRNRLARARVVRIACFPVAQSRQTRQSSRSSPGSLLPPRAAWQPQRHHGGRSRRAYII